LSLLSLPLLSTEGFLAGRSFIEVLWQAKGAREGTGGCACGLESRRETPAGELSPQRSQGWTGTRPLTPDNALNSVLAWR